MANRAHDERNVRKITKSGNSYSITLPVEAVKELKWKEKQKVVVKLVRGKMIVEDWKE